MKNQNKIGIITFHNINNYGALLQTFSLYNYLNNNCNAKIEVIDFIQNDRINDYKLYGKVKRLLGNLIFFYKRKNIIYRNIKFNNLRKKIIFSKKTFFGDDDIEHNCVGYDILISGSDQIFNFELSGKSKAYFLNFDHNAKKISYASSFGKKIISVEEKEMIRKYLVKYNFLSCREKSGCDIIKNVINVDVNLVVDPVFLLSKKDWNSFLNLNNKKEYDYVLIYVMEKKNILDKIIKEIKCENPNFKFIIINGGKKENYSNLGNVINNAGPLEFLSYILNSSIVITNSFHGLAFSLIFGKKILCFDHSTRNERLYNLLSLIECESLQLNDKIDININDLNNYLIDGNEKYLKLSNIIESSKEYLLEAIKKIEEGNL